MRRLSIVLNIVLVAVLAGAALGLPAAGGASLQYVNLPAPSFEGLTGSAHNDGNANPPDACPAKVPLEQGDEHFGDLSDSKGSFEEFVRLPDGAAVKSLSLFANDFDTDNDVHAYLVRKLIADGTTPKEKGYRVMAETSSSGAVDSTIREFTDNTVKSAVVDNTKYMYYVELVICANTVEPFMTQVAYSG